MENTFQRSSLSASFLLFFVLFSLSCKKEKIDDKTVVGITPVAKTLSVDKTTGTPGDVIMVTTTFILDKDNYDLTVGNKKTALMKVNDSTGVFVIPYISSGEVSVDFGVTGLATKKSLTISAYTPVADPEIVVNSYKSQLAAGILESEQYAATMPYTATLKSLEATFTREYVKLSTEERKEFAFMINKAMSLTAIESSAPLMATQSRVLGKTATMNSIANANANADGEDVYREGLKFVDLSAKTVLLVCSSAILLITPDPTLATKVLATATTTLSILYLMRTLEQVGIMTRTIGKHFNTASASTVSNSTINLRMAVTAASMTTMAANEPIATFVFSRQKPTVSFQVYSEYHGFSEKDRTQGTTLYTKVFANINSLLNINNQLKNQLDKMTSFFSSIAPFPSWKNPVASTPIAEVHLTPGTKLSVENVSDPAIKLTATAIGSTVKLSTEGSTAIADRKFTFELVYKDTQLGITNRKVFEGTYGISIAPVKAEIASGNNQVIVLGSKLPAPLKVRVLDKDNEGVEGAIVEWKIKAGGGMLSVTSSAADASGRAQVEWTPGMSGTQEVEAVIRGKDGLQISGSPLTFSVTTIDLVGKWRVSVDYWKVYTFGGTFLFEENNTPFEIEFLDNNVVRLYNANNIAGIDEGTYRLDSSGQYVVLYDVQDGLMYKYDISDLTTNGLILTAGPVFNWKGETGYRKRLLTLKR